MSGETLDARAVPLRAPHRRCRDHRRARVPCRPPLRSRWAASSRTRPTALSRILKMLGEAGYFRVVMIHHPPNLEAAIRASASTAPSCFRKAVAENGAELILHGHTHKSSIFAIPGLDRRRPGGRRCRRRRGAVGGWRRRSGPLQPLQDRAPRHGLELHHARIWLSAPQHRYCAEAKSEIY